MRVSTDFLMLEVWQGDMGLPSCLATGGNEQGGMG